ncbi:MAG: carbohydrate kinase family protein [Crenarchaeota archaeon]|nr:carbohydrate kinase family protein [Thermoproteota archaeon]
MSAFGVVGFGALNVDKLFKVDRLAHAEEESFVISQEEICGGSAANTTVGLARLGVNVGFIGKIALDREGDLQLADFTKEHVDTNGLIKAKFGHSGNVMGFVDKKGARALYIQSGINDTITHQEVNQQYFSQTQFLHLSSFVGEQSFNTQKTIVQNLPNSIKVSFDPGILYIRKGLAQLESIIKKTYIIMPNNLELEELTGESDCKKGAQILLNIGVKIVAVKMGANGCFVTDGKEDHFVDPFNVEVVDTTGAGDAFCAGFLYGLLNKKSLKECGRLGNFVGSRCVMKLGARPGLPYITDLKLLS